MWWTGNFSSCLYAPVLIVKGDFRGHCRSRMVSPCFFTDGIKTHTHDTKLLTQIWKLLGSLITIWTPARGREAQHLIFICDKGQLWKKINSYLNYIQLTQLYENMRSSWVQYHFVLLTNLNSKPPKDQLTFLKHYEASLLQMVYFLTPF